MDSCSSCRRPLNGALVCPGCGAYAPDIDPHSTTSRARRAAGTAAATSATAVREKTAAGGDVDTVVREADLGTDPVTDSGTDADGRAEAGAGGEEGAAGGGMPDDGGADEVQAPAPATEADLPALHTGRAGRRLQVARWTRNKRRAAAATALALIGGGITVGAMASGPGKAPRTASAPDPSAPQPSVAPTTGAGGTTDGVRGGGPVPSTAGALSPSVGGGYGSYSPYGPYRPGATVRRPPATSWRTASGSVVGGTTSAPPGTPTTPTGGTPGTTPPHSPTPSPSPHHLCILFVCLP